MIVFVDLDGTLTHTADVKYKEFKDGLRDFLLVIKNMIQT